MIEVLNLAKSFGVFQAVRGINFTIQKGEVVGLLGRNGAGKTTTMRMMTGFYTPSKGKVKIAGYEVESHKQDVQKMIGYLPESASSYSDMLVGDFLHFVADARNLDKTQAKKGIEKAVVATGLQKYYYRPILHLSKGYRQRVGLASALLHDPSVLILDEPTSGLDPVQKKEIQNLIKELSKEKTIILSTHILGEVEDVCKRAIIIADGKIVRDDSLERMSSRGENKLKLNVSVKGRVANITDICAREFGASGDTVAIEYTTDSETRFNIISGPDAGERVFKMAVANQLVLKEIAPEKESLEDVFQSLTGGDQ